MSNTLTTYNEEVKNEVEVLDEQPIEVEEPVAEESAPEATQKAPKQKKGSWAYRIFSLLLLGLIAAAVILPVSVIRIAGVDSMPLYEVVMKYIEGVYTSPYPIFGVLPTLVGASTFDTVAGIAMYVLLLCLVIAAIVLLIDLFAGRKKGAKFAAFLVTLGLALYTLSVYVTSAFSFHKAKLDYYLIGGFGIALFIYFILCLIKNKKVWYNFVQAILSIAAVGAIAYVLCENSASVALLEANMFKNILVHVAAGIAVFVLIAVLFRVNVKKGQPFELVLYILELIAGGIVVFLAMTEIKADNLYAIVAAGIALVQVIMTAVALGIIKKKVKKAQAVEEVEAIEEAPAEEVAEEAVEAVVYEGGPIPVAMAESAEPVEEVVAIEEEPVVEAVEEPAPVCGVQTAEYDFYNSRAFDPFIAILDSEERNQFTELFILRYKGTFEHLPDYVVGGDNKEFFHKFFIYLGQYRDRIPDGLMAKIYHFSTKI